MMASKERAQVALALIAWFKSQNVSPDDGAAIMAEVCGSIARGSEQLDRVESFMRNAWRAKELNRKGDQ